MELTFACLPALSLQDVQNLSSKFRCDETASIQQAMRWVHTGSLLPSVMHMPAGSLMMGDTGDTGTTDRGALAEAQWSGQVEDVFLPLPELGVVFCCLLLLPFCPLKSSYSCKSAL